MSLATGTRVGPYEVVAPIGAGGMGEVYRARDERIGRDVAIKVLPAEFAADPDRLRRFEQEARAAGQLNHPNILTVHDTGTHEDSPYIVTELLEGETLRERLRGGGLGVRKAVEIAVQIAHGLAAAHEKGIIHRDLKPANVFVTKDGHVKILDFGVAKLLHPEASVDVYAKTTASGPTTEAGVVVGTAGYISPEQLRGLPADHRSDIFALGCVLHEMLSGKAPFLRATNADTAAAILHEEPASLVGPGREVPAGLRAVVERCLEKQPEERFQSARDLAFNLETLSGTSGEAAAVTSPARVAARSRIRERLPWVMALAGVLLGIAGFVAVQRRPRPPRAEVVRFSVTAPEGGALLNDVSAVAVSPDGRRLVFTVIDAAGTMRLFMRLVGSLAAQALTGTEGATFPFWSPDSRFVAFFAQGKLRKVPVGGGAAEVICNAPNGRGGSWSKDGVIVFAPVSLGPLLRVSAEGGEPTEVAKPDAAKGETGLRFPCFLPDGRHFLYVSLPRRQTGFDVLIGALDSKEPRRIGSAFSAPIYGEPGFLLFTLGDRLIAQRFDRAGLQLVGEAMPLGDAPPTSTFDAGAALTASATGVLVHAASSPPMTELVWLDRAGRQTGRIPLPPGSYSNPSLSPDGRFATVTKFNAATSYDLWLVDLQRSVMTRLTFDGLVAGGLGQAVPVVWSPDSTRVAYGFNRAGVCDVYQVLTNGSAKPEPMVTSDEIYKYPAAWSPDGKYFVFTAIGEGSQYDLWVLPLQGDRTPRPYLRTPFTEDAGAISPDGRWLAYDSDETGTPEIYVRSFPQPGERYRVSTSGGTFAQWSSDGKELLFLSPSEYFYGSGPIYAVNVETRPTFKAGTPRLLFTPRPDISGLAVTADLSRFLATVPAEGAPPASITVTLNWPAALEH